MFRTVSFLLLLAGCTTELPSTSAVDAATPPMEAPVQMVLSTGEMIAGQTFTVTASGANPGDSVFFGYSLDGFGSGPGLSALGGLSLDLAFPPRLAPGANPVVADADGIATLSFTLPSTVPSGFQAAMQAAVAAGSSSYLSNPLLVEVGGCADDIHEDDDDAASASVVEHGQRWHGRVCTGDEDWFSIDVTEGTVIDMSVGYTLADGNVEIFLYDDIPTNPAQDFVAISQTATDSDRITYTAPSTGTYYLRVFVNNGNSPGSDYDLDVVALPPALSYDVTWSTTLASGQDDPLELIIDNRYMNAGVNGLPADGMTLTWNSPTGGSGNIIFSNGGTVFTGVAQFPGEGPITYEGVLSSNVYVAGDPAMYNSEWMAGGVSGDDQGLALQIRNRYDIVTGSNPPADFTTVSWTSAVGGSADILFSDSGMSFAGTAQYPGEGPIGYAGLLP